MALSGRFDRAFRRLTAAFGAYIRTERSPQNLPELSQRRTRLDEARSEMANVRSDEGLRFPKRTAVGLRPFRGGAGSTSRFGKTTVIVFATFLVIGLVSVVLKVGPIRFGPVDNNADFVFDNVTETVTDIGNGDCSWVVEFRLRNTSSETIRLHWIDSTLLRYINPRPRFRSDESGMAERVLEPSQSTTGRLAFDLTGCPLAGRALRHGPIVIAYSDDPVIQKTATFGF